MPEADGLTQVVRSLVDGPVDAERAYARVVRRQRLRRARRWSAVGAVMAAAVVGGVVALPGSSDDARQVEVVDDAVGEHEPSVPAPSTSRLLLYGDDGIAVVEGGASTRVWEEPVRLAVPDGIGGMVFQGDEGPILWMADTADLSGTAAVVAAGAWLHTVVELDGEPTVLFTRREGEGEAETETLHAYGVLSRSARSLATTGGLESGLDAVAMLPDGELVVSTCHLQCSVGRLSDRESDAATAARIVAPDWIAGLDIAARRIAYIRYEFSPEGGVVSDPALVVADADGVVQTEVRLPYDVDGSGGGRVDLDESGRRAVVTLRAPDGRERAALVRDLDAALPAVDALGDVGASFGDLVGPPPPDTVIALAGRELAERSVATGEVVRSIATLPEGEVPSWIEADLAHGRVFVGSSSCDQVATIWSVPVEGGEPALVTSGGPVSVSPDGSTVAFSRRRDGCAVTMIVVRDLASGEERSWAIDGQVGEVGDVGWAPDGRHLAYTVHTQPDGVTRVHVLDTSDPAAVLGDGDGIEGWLLDSQVVGAAWHLVVARPCAGEPCASRIEIVDGSTGEVIADLGSFDGVSDVDLDVAGVWALFHREGLEVIDGDGLRRVTSATAGDW